MAEYSKLVMTKKGQALQAKMIAGTGNVQFTKVASSDAQYTVAQLEGLTSLSSVKQTTLISKVERTNTVAIKVEAAFSNTELKTGYYMRTLGLYALDPNEGEILYAACIETSGSCYMPPYNGVTVTGAYIQMYQTVGNAENVSLTVNPGAYATIGDIQELESEIADLKAYIGYTDNDIYGVEVDFVNKRFTRLAGATNKTAGDGFDDVNAFGGRRRCNITDSGVVVAYQGDAAFTTTGKLTMAVDLNPEGTANPDTNLQFAVGTNVQVMVEQPKFYYKVVPLELEKIEGGKGFHMRKARYYVSDTMKSGFKLHPAFIKDGNEKNFIYMSAYEGCTYDTSASAYKLNDAQDVDWTNDVLASIAGAKPTSGLTQSGATRNGFRTIAAKRGSGWSQQTIQAATATQILFLVEYASFNIQEKLGAGVTTKVDDGATSMTEITGATTTLGNKSGQVINTNGYSVVAYRGEENPFGNLWKWVDGINTNNGSTFAEGDTGTIYVADHGFKDDSGDAPYHEVGFSSVYIGWSYISAFGYAEDDDWLFYPTEGKGNSSLPVGDCGQVVSPGWRAANLGAIWNHGSYSGLFCLSVGSDSGGRNRTVGGRLLYVPDGTDAPAA